MVQAARPVNTKLCSDISTSSVASPDSPWQQDNLEEYEQLNLWKSTPTRSPCCERTSQTSPFTQTSETTTQDEESSISLPVAFPAQAQVTPESEKDSSTQTQPCGEKDSAVSVKDDPGLSLWNSLKDLSNEDFAQRLEDSEWQAIAGTLRSSDRQRKSELCTKEPGFLSCPTLNSCSSPSSRPAGQTKCEKWFKDNGLIRTGYQLSAPAMAKLMGFPEDWFQALSPSLPTTQDELEPDTLPGEPLHLDKRRSPSVESSISTQLLGVDNFSISIPCLVKQPGQDELKGVIKQDLGDCFVIYIPSSSSTVSVSKLFVYPDLSKSVGQIEKNPSKNFSPSKNIQRKTRRRKGEGSGSIYYRTVTRNGKDYQQAYYHWVEGGKKRSLYIPKKLLDRVGEAEGRNLPVNDILILLGEKNINPSKNSDTSFDEKNKINDEVIDTCEISPSKIFSPSKTQRGKGEGSGSIHCKPIKRSGKEYPQYWYHYEFWERGDRLVKSSKYIPKGKLAQVQQLDNQKVPVREILKLLGVRRKNCARLLNRKPTNEVSR